MSQSASERDRYVSFIGLDCDENARRLVARIRLHIDVPGQSNAFWDKFRARLEGEDSQNADELFLVHSYVYYIRDLFEAFHDKEGLELLDQVEEECC